MILDAQERNKSMTLRTKTCQITQIRPVRDEALGSVTTMKPEHRVTSELGRSQTHCCTSSRPHGGVIVKNPTPPIFWALIRVDLRV